MLFVRRYNVPTQQIDVFKADCMGALCSQGRIVSGVMASKAMNGERGSNVMVFFVLHKIENHSNCAANNRVGKKPEWGAK